LVVGLGNPGADYARTRHNLGAEAALLVAGRHGQSLRPEKGTRSDVGQVRLPSGLMAVAVPHTFMNESGLAVAALVRRFGVEDLRHLVIVHDELDLPSGRVKVKVGGGTAGNNGLKSIHSHLHDPGYVRVRIGVGKPPGRQPGADYVLHRPGKAERGVLDVAVAVAADAVEVIAAEGPDAAMLRFNTELSPE
jgi:peptidyl-tRNA hydrolase, PTH1 family